MEPNRSAQIKDLKERFRTTKELHLYMQLELRYYLPSLTSAACTRRYLEGVYLQEYWCPKYQDVRKNFTQSPPVSIMLYLKLERFRLENHERFSIQWGFTDKRLPNKEWLMDVVSTVLPDDEIFQKDYKAGQSQMRSI